MRYTRNRLLSIFTLKEVLAAETAVRENLSDQVYTVWRFRDAPSEIRSLCNLNGGDEDWLALTNQEPEYLPLWIECLDSCREPDVYLLNGAVIYVGSHA